MNGYEVAARERKAAALAFVFTSRGAAADAVRKLDDDGRHAAEQLAMVNPASETTWERVAEIIERCAA